MLSHLDKKCLLRRESRSWVQFLMHPLFHTANTKIWRYSSAVLAYQMLCNMEDLEKTKSRIWSKNIIILFAHFHSIDSLIILSFVICFTITRDKPNPPLTGSTAHLLYRKLRCFPSLLWRCSTHFLSSILFLPFSLLCHLTKHCHSCFDLTHRHSPDPSGNLSSLWWVMTPAKRSCSLFSFFLNQIEVFNQILPFHTHKLINCLSN